MATQEDKSTMLERKSEIRPMLNREESCSPGLWECSSVVGSSLSRLTIGYLMCSPHNQHSFIENYKCCYNWIYRRDQSNAVFKTNIPSSMFQYLICLIMDFLSHLSDILTSTMYKQSEIYIIYVLWSIYLHILGNIWL